MGRKQPLVTQAWIEILADDPEATSAFAVARLRLPAAAQLKALRRLRLFELTGPLPELEAQEDLLHRSTQFYNPHKERCTLRASREEPAPVWSEEHVVLVAERGGVRRPAAERWWHHETGKVVEVREAVAWVLGFEPGTPAGERAEELAIVRTPRHGLFCNPHSQAARLSGSEVPLPWITETTE